jgi:amino acid adenylation domain-containing protein
MSSKISTVPRLLREQTTRTPDFAAVVDGALSLTYRELTGHVHRLANRLVARGIRRGDLIGLRAGPSADRIVAMLAILHAGAAYVPLESTLPDERLRLMAADARVRAVLTVAPLDWRLSTVDTIGYAVGDAATGSFPDRAPDVEVDPDDLMYVPYTSGSTGRPKGVEVPHRSIPGFFAGEDYGEWGPGRRVLHHSAMSWDGHVFELYPALLSGGTVLVHRGDAKNPLDVAQAAQHLGSTMLLLATQAFNTVVAERPQALGGLRCLVVGGEVASRDHLRTAMSLHPHLRIVNAYGPVECTCLATVRLVEPRDLELPAVPVGRRAGDREIHLLDERLRPVPEGKVGEVYLGGSAVARGYLGRPALTAERFVPDPFGAAPGARLYRTGDLARCTDGVYDFVGRVDDQVKLRGFRIEPGEIDMVLRTHPAVRDAATVVTTGPTGPRLVSYVVPGGGHVTGLRGYLRDRLPEAMVPGTVVGLDRFPTTHSGKLDRHALPPPQADPPGAEAVTRTERRLAGIWRQLLGAADVCRGDDFFELGGHSLLATRLVLRVQQELDAQVALRDVYDHPTLGELAELIDLRRTAAVPT